MQEKYGFVYIWFDSFRKKFYIGCRWGRENDGYICSSNRMRNAYNRRKEDFKRRILAKTNNRSELFDLEYKWLQLISDEEVGIKYYNSYYNSMKGRRIWKIYILIMRQLHFQNRKRYINIRISFKHLSPNVSRLPA